jgi:hypothetical protein
MLLVLFLFQCGCMHGLASTASAEAHERRIGTPPRRRSDDGRAVTIISQTNVHAKNRV